MTTTDANILDAVDGLRLELEQLGETRILVERLLAFAVEVNNRLPAPTNRADRDAGYGCNPETVAVIKDARKWLLQTQGVE